MTTDYNVTRKRDRARFVFDTWEDTAAWGYGAYFQRGRGAVVISDLGDGPSQPRYFLQADIEAAVTKGTSRTALLAMVREYNPDLEIVVCFDIPGYAFAYGRYQVDTQPPKDLWLKHTSKGVRQ